MAVKKEIRRTRSPRPKWCGALSRYARPDTRKAVWQLTNTLIPYLALWGLMVYNVTRGISYGITLLLSVLAAGLLLRLFIIFHDCCHQSFLASKRANRVIGYITGILTFTPFEAWQYAHLTHHGTVGDLDRRGTGDIKIMTVNEYRTAPAWKRLAYRAYRHPLVILGLGPAFLALMANRIALPGSGRKGWFSAHVTNLGILLIVLGASLTMGLKTYLLIQLPVLAVSWTVGVWLFYVQHQFQGVYWARHADWDPVKAAMNGSSYLKLPGVLQWFSGNIGLHHIHHLNPRIPNYRLQQCYNENPTTHEVRQLSLMASFRALGMKLWDEQTHQLVSFRSLKHIA